LREEAAAKPPDKGRSRSAHSFAETNATIRFITEASALSIAAATLAGAVEATGVSR